LLDCHSLKIIGIRWKQDLLWLAFLDDPIVATYDPVRDQSEVKLHFPHPLTDICPSEEGLWLIAGGGKLGRRVVLWSIEENREIREFDCPDGAAGGMALEGSNLWLTHRHNRKLFCLDHTDGKVSWVIKTEKEIFRPDFHKGALWLIECKPGPLGHWSRPEQAEYFFIRYDTAWEKVVERLRVPFVPSCMALDGERFWYAEEGKKGFSSIPRQALTEQ